MTRHPRLHKRGNTFYVRARVPKDIKDTYPKTEEKWSLGTTDPKEALRLVRIASVEIDKKFEAHRKQLEREKQPSLEALTLEQIQQLGRLYFAARLEEDEEIRQEGFYEPEDLQSLPDDPLPTFEEYQEQSEALNTLLKHDFPRGRDSANFYRSEAEDLLEWEGIEVKLSPDSSSWKPLTRELQKASIMAHDAIKKRNSGEIVEAPSVEESHVFTSNLQPSVNDVNRVLLSEAVSDWVREKERTTWNAKTSNEHQVWMNHFIVLTGDKFIDEYNKADARLFKNLLSCLPPNYVKLGILKGLSFQKAALKSKQLDLEPMSPKTLNKILQFVGSFFNWARANYDEVKENIFYGLKVPVRKNKRDERHPFTPEQLNTIFNAPLFTGCVSLHHWNKEGSYVPWDSGKYWVPLIALFSGARAGEIIQLYVEDINEEEGVYYMDINSSGEDKKLKTSTSHRNIPIHSKLIELGFLEYVKYRKNKNDSVRLFPDLPLGNDGYYSSVFGKFFSRLLRDVGAKTDTSTFHSFRHNFEDACRNNGIAYEIMNALQGHAEQGMSGRYGQGYSVQYLKDQIDKVKYQGLNLEHLLKNKP